MPSDWTSDGRSVLVTSAWRHVGSEIFAVPATWQRLRGSSWARRTRSSVFFPDQSPSGAVADLPWRG